MSSGLERKISLSESSLRSFGIKDYTEELKKRKTEEDSFGGIYNQEKAISKFFEALNSRYRALLNLGECGVGKSTITRELATKLKELSNGKEIEGKYSKEMKKFYQRLREHQHKDIIALWNPQDYNKPILIKTSPEKGYSSKLEDDTRTLSDMIYDNEYYGLRDIIADEYVNLMINDAFIKFIEKNGDKDFTFELSKENNEQKVYAVFIDEEGNKSKNEDFNNMLKTNYMKSLSAKLDHSPNELKIVWNKHIKEIPKNYNQESTIENEQKTDKDILENTLDQIINKNIEDISTVKEEWKNVDEINMWFECVENYFSDYKIRQKVKEELKNEINKNIKEIKDSLIKDEKFIYHTFPLRMRYNKEEFFISSLLEPNILYEANNDAGLIVRELSVFDYADLFGYVETIEGGPVHENIELGALALSDIVIVDDDFLPLLKDDVFRRSLLSFLQDGKLTIMQDKCEVSLNNDCYFIVNDTQYPFIRQNFEGMMPEQDSAMARRFNIVEWNSYVENNPQNRANFAAIIEKSINEYQARNKVDCNINIPEESINILIQYVLSENNQDMLTMQIGNLETGLLEPIIIKALNDYEDEKQIIDITPEMIKKYIGSKKDKTQENITLDFALQEYSNDNLDLRKIGTANYLAVTNMGHGTVGSVTASLTNKTGDISSLDSLAEMTDKTHNKGILNAETWFNENLGALYAGVNMSHIQFGGIGGPSSSGVQTYALMSKIGNIPIKQNVYVTGTTLDNEGNVGVIGGVYEKVRGAYLFHNKINKGNEPCITLVPENNVKELMRKVMFDEELTQALEKGNLEIKYHSTIWDGFESISGMAREEYEPIIKKNIRNLNKETALRDFKRKYLPFLSH